ncbi:MAG: SOS response-associated peptidase family protein [Polaromonas sp.]|uniref:SOS response-associated peptidase family protein n=1 Tax=Polaromonas sp. TaxID=1869339 RepID=UPI00248A7DAA|nr:SOS response-associated peptidase family protein [Polaromonas sp.]MDI1270840.1 SOS response-associated peptidase family protein [Polaromonas sp.]
MVQSTQAGYAGLQTLRIHWPQQPGRKNQPTRWKPLLGPCRCLLLNNGKLRQKLEASLWGADLWESWTGADGDVIISYTLLTVNANSHALMSRYQQPGNEKRMLAILNEGALDAWLSARPEKAREFMRAYPANWLTANPVEKSR